MQILFSYACVHAVSIIYMSTHFQSKDVYIIWGHTALIHLTHTCLEVTYCTYCSYTLHNLEAFLCSLVNPLLCTSINSSLCNVHKYFFTNNYHTTRAKNHKYREGKCSLLLEHNMTIYHCLRQLSYH